MSSVRPAFGAGNHNNVIFAGTVTADPKPLQAQSGIWTTFQLEASDGWPPLAVKCWKDLAKFVLENVRAGRQITAKGELEVSAHGYSLKTSFLELVPLGINLPKPARALAMLSGTVKEAGTVSHHDKEAVVTKVKVLTGRESSFDICVEGRFGQGGESIVLLQGGDYVLIQGALKLRRTDRGWEPVLESTVVLGAFPFEVAIAESKPSVPSALAPQKPLPEAEPTQPRESLGSQIAPILTPEIAAKPAVIEDDWRIDFSDLVSSKMLVK